MQGHYQVGEYESYTYGKVRANVTRRGHVSVNCGLATDYEPSSYYFLFLFITLVSIVS